MGKTLEKLLVAGGFTARAIGTPPAIYGLFSDNLECFVIGHTVLTVGAMTATIGVGLKYFREFCEQEDMNEAARRSQINQGKDLYRNN